ncbi:hypothetical protein [Kitasatospora sp. NPDC088134]|uniref:hypothetical protein n=1 Tax=Kitasatospora sp. NPDC088134 TaxID=3364071 RepID=UPI0038142E32
MQAPQGELLVADEEFDLVIGDLEQDVPEHRLTRMDSAPHGSSCVRVYCCF